MNGRPDSSSAELDSDLIAFLTEEMGLCFPRDAAEDRTPLRGATPVMIYIQAAALLSVDALGAYTKIALHSKLGRPVNLGWLTEQLNGTVSARPTQSTSCFPSDS